MLGSARYSLLLALLGITQLALARGRVSLALPLLWSGLSFLVAGAAYVRFGPGLFGKRPDGTLPARRALLLLPYLAFTWSVWHLQRFLTREPYGHEIVPGLWLGRRPFARELPPAIGLVVDLTAEFPAARDVAARCRYLCVPTLDGSVPNEASFREAVETILACEGDAYVHCAVGHGRSATLVAAVLLARGAAATPAEAEALIRQVRPSVSLNAAQRRLLSQTRRPGIPH